jgi:hypothetical protein
LKFSNQINNKNDVQISDFEKFGSVEQKGRNNNNDSEKTTKSKTQNQGAKDNKDTLRLKVMIKLLQNGFRNSIHSVDSSTNDKHSASLTPELQRAFQEIFDECEKLILTNEHRQAQAKNVRGLIRKMKKSLNMIVMESKHDDKHGNQVTPTSELEQKKYLAALGLM